MWHTVWLASSVQKLESENEALLSRGFIFMTFNYTTSPTLEIARFILLAVDKALLVVSHCLHSLCAATLTGPALQPVFNEQMDLIFWSNFLPVGIIEHFLNDHWIV